MIDHSVQEIYNRTKLIKSIRIRKHLYRTSNTANHQIQWGRMVSRIGSLHKR